MTDHHRLRWRRLESRHQLPLGLWLVNAGHLTLSFAVMGAILGGWR